MGGDGGSIPTRDVLAKTKKADKTRKQVTFGGSTLSDWTRCHLTSELLAEPIVCDSLGHLFNKAALIESMLNGTMPKSLSHIARIARDTVNCRIQTIEKAKAANSPLFECPVSGLAANGKFGFVVLRACGCFLSERALKNVKGTECPNCGDKLDEAADDWARIPINPDGQRADELFKMVMHRIKSRKKKKRKRGKAAKIGKRAEKKPTLSGKKRVLEEAEEKVA